MCNRVTVANRDTVKIIAVSIIAIKLIFAPKIIGR
jgi:hypothetical protein